jgi:hypothetical protein
VRHEVARGAFAEPLRSAGAEVSGVSFPCTTEGKRATPLTSSGDTSANQPPREDDVERVGRDKQVGEYVVKSGIHVKWLSCTAKKRQSDITLWTERPTALGLSGSPHTLWATGH